MGGEVRQDWFDGVICSERRFHHSSERLQERRQDFGRIPRSLPGKQKSPGKVNPSKLLLHIKAPVPACHDEVEEVFKVNTLDRATGPRPEFEIERNEAIGNRVCDC
jgi:hypothetical protein